MHPVQHRGDQHIAHPGYTLQGVEIIIFFCTRTIEIKSVIIFDEIQLFPKARQAIKHLVKDSCGLHSKNKVVPIEVKSAAIKLICHKNMSICIETDFDHNKRAKRMIDKEKGKC